MTVFIDVGDLASYPGVVLSPEDATNELVVNLANGIVSDILGDQVPDPIPTRLLALVLEVAARALRNPEGYDSVTTQIDDWKKTIRREGDDLSPGVFLTDKEESYLLRLLGRGSVGVGSIKLRVPGYATTYTY